MEANAVAVRVRNPCHPAYPRLDGLNEYFHAMSAADVNRSANVVYRKRDARRPTPVPFGMTFMSRAVERKRQRFGGEFTPEIIPLLSALEAKKLLIKGTGPAHVFRAIHHEIKRPNGNGSLAR